MNKQKTAFEITRIGRYTLIQSKKPRLSPKDVTEIEKTLDDLMLQGQQDLVLDFSELQLLDSSLLGVIGTTYTKLSRLKGSLAAVLNEQIESAFNLSGFNFLVKVLENKSDIPGYEPSGHKESRTNLTDSRCEEKDGMAVILAGEELSSIRAAKQFNSLVRKQLKRGIKRMVFDFRDLKQVSSMVIGTVVYAFKELEKEGGNIWVLARDPDLRGLLDISGLNDFTGTFDSVEKLLEQARARKENLDQKTVLVVDDSKTMRTLASRILRKFGYQPLLAEDGIQGVEIALRDRPDVILMDVQMPRKDGYQACREIKAQITDQHIPVVFVTALQDPKERFKALEAGGDDFVNKPPQEDDLIFRVKTHLHIKQLTEELMRMNQTLETKVEEKTTALLETERQLMQAEKLSTVGTMLSGIAHEIKNPIFIISGFVRQMARDEALAGKHVSKLEQIGDQATKCHNIVENLLQLARNKATESVSLDPDKVIEELMANLQHLATGKDVKLDRDLRGACRIRANPMEMEQIVVNLVSNAIDALETGGRVKIRTFVEDGKYALEVEDDGCGMPEDVKNKLFDPFFTTKPPGKGTGLGMTLVMKFIQAHGATINVKTRPGKGTLFAIRFPMNRE